MRRHPVELARALGHMEASRSPLRRHGAVCRASHSEFFTPPSAASRSAFLSPPPCTFLFVRSSAFRAYLRCNLFNRCVYSPAIRQSLYASNSANGHTSFLIKHPDTARSRRKGLRPLFQYRRRNRLAEPEIYRYLASISLSPAATNFLDIHIILRRSTVRLAP